MLFYLAEIFDCLFKNYLFRVIPLRVFKYMSSSFRFATDSIREKLPHWPTHDFLSKAFITSNFIGRDVVNMMSTMADGHDFARLIISG